MSLDNALSKAAKQRLGITVDADRMEYNGLQRSLSRLTMSVDVRRRIASLLADGSSLSVSDTDTGLETGEGTDFITITRAP
ncbi:hypothetical protein SS05631_c10440 [Sinorhizobium sp. CCBAU 05631]|nr:hypothetical protein SS05631_c10440 [Sinorhizobium sp. CCBAU 05631]